VINMKNKLYLKSILAIAIFVLQGCMPGPSLAPISDKTNTELIQLLETYEYGNNATSPYEFNEIIDEIARRGKSASEVSPMLAKVLAFDGSASVYASHALVAMGSSAKPSITNLKANLNHPREDVRRYSVFVLGIIGEDANCAVPTIASLLWDKDPFVRSASAGALTEITHINLVENEYDKLDSELVGSVNKDEPEGKISRIAREWWLSIGQYEEYPPCSNK
jgi:hypothetical protein